MQKDGDDANAVVFKYPELDANGYCDEAIPGCSCAPPRTLTSGVVVVATSPDDGLTGPATPVVGCAAAGALPWAALALLRRRRRR